MGLFKRDKTTESDAVLSVEEAQEKADRQKLTDELSNIQSVGDRLAQEHRNDEEFQDLRKKAYEELTDATEPHTYLRAAQIFLFEDRQNELERRNRIKLAIGYATIGEIEEAKKIVDCIAFTKVPYDDGSREKYRDDRPLALAEVAYYSGWIGGLSTKAKVAEFASKNSYPSEMYNARYIPWSKERNQEEDEKYHQLAKAYKDDPRIIAIEIEQRQGKPIDNEEYHRRFQTAGLYIDLLVDIAIAKYKESQKEIDG